MACSPVRSKARTVGVRCMARDLAWLHVRVWTVRVLAAGQSTIYRALQVATIVEAGLYGLLTSKAGWCVICT